MDPAFEDAWKQLRQRLDRRASETSDVVRAYPTPIARCDDQLPKFIAERRVAVAQAFDAAAVDAVRGVRRRGRIARCVALLDPADDFALARMRADLLARIVLDAYPAPARAGGARERSAA